jgi:predicted TPR repeat methyltransferase
LLVLARSQDELGNLAEVRAAYESVLQLDPGNEVAEQRLEALGAAE